MHAETARRRRIAAWLTFISDVRRGAGYATGAAMVFGVALALKVLLLALLD